MPRVNLAVIFLVFNIFLVASAGNKCDPSQIHIALSDDFASQLPHSKSPIRVVFHTEDSCDSTYIQLETPNGAQKILATSVEHFQETYSKIAYQTYVHTFDFPSLDYDQSYQYTCHSDSSSQGPFKFYVPNPLPNDRVNSVVIFGDHDHTPVFGMPTVKYLNSLVEKNFTSIQAFIHLGDIAYDLEYLGGKHGDNYMNAIQGFAASMPLMVTFGNHETLNNFSNANMRFKMPNNNNHYHSYNIGNMHFVSINLDLAIENSGLLAPMLDWLAKDLQNAQANRAVAPWIIFYTHRPLYCSDTTTGDCDKNAQKFAQLEDLLNQYNVDLYLSGHVHYYERMFPIYRGEVAQFDKVSGDTDYRYIVNPTAPVYIVQGKAGHLGDFEKKPYDGKNYTVNVGNSYSALAMHALNNTHLYLENLQSKTGKVLDDFYIIKKEKKSSIEEEQMMLRKKMRLIGL